MMQSHALERLKDEWNDDRLTQDLFGVEWAIGERVAALNDYVPNFLWTYGSINDNNEFVSIIVIYFSAIMILFKIFIFIFDID
jgi:hypothetical protein